MQKTNEQYMTRCLQLASYGAGLVAPNPMVGSVVVYNDTIIGEGYHHQYGSHHAEVNAINSVKDKSLLKHSTIYVNLEPCAHFGKTPPCSLLIINSKIPRVVIGCTDTFSKVAGEGIRMMQDAGIEVITDVLKHESRELNRRFFTYHEKKRPYIILKWAETKDGFIDADRDHKSEKPRWISNPFCRLWVHKQRTEENAILIGTNTAQMDNPSLTVRDWTGKQPLRCVLDLNNRLTKSLHLFDESTRTIVFSTTAGTSNQNITYVEIDIEKDIIPQILNSLHKLNCLSVIIEGGTKLLQTFIDLGLWDEASVYVGNTTFEMGVKAPLFHFTPKTEHKIRDTRLLMFRND